MPLDQQNALFWQAQILYKKGSELKLDIFSYKILLVLCSAVVQRSPKINQMDFQATGPCINPLFSGDNEVCMAIPLLGVRTTHFSPSIHLIEHSNRKSWSHYWDLFHVFAFKGEVPQSQLMVATGQRAAH
jgi:hypothetical protein